MPRLRLEFDRTTDTPESVAEALCSVSENLRLPVVCTVKGVGMVADCAAYPWTYPHSVLEEWQKEHEMRVGYADAHHVGHLIER